VSLPTFTFEVGFGSTPLLASPTFTDLAADLETLSVARGRQSEDDQAQTGTCQGTLLDTTRKYDPNNTAGAFYPNVQTMQPCRVIATLDGTPYAVFYGWIDIQNGWVRIENDAAAASVLVPCNDGFEILNNGRVFSRTFAYDYADAVNFYSPALYWKFDEPSGTVAHDASGNGHTGTFDASWTLNQSPAPIGDPASRSASMNNSVFTTGCKAAAYNLFYGANTKYTVMGWANRSAIGNVNNLFDPNGTSMSVWLSNANAVDVLITTNSGANTQTWAGAWPGLSQWVHWAVTLDAHANAASLYINGVYKGTVSMSNWTTGAFRAGGLFNGGLDEYAVFESILSPANIAAIYAARLQAPPSAVVTSPGIAFTQELTGARINDVLGTGDVSGVGIGLVPQWPAGWRDIDAGNATMQSIAQAADVSTSPLQLIRDAEITEPGFFYFDGRGYACFRDRRSRPLSTSKATFCDTHNTAGGRILYDSLTTRRTAIVNDARATRTGGALQEAVDEPSRALRLTRSKDYTTQHVDDPSALAYAQWQLSLKKDSYEVVESLTLVPGTDSPTWLQILSRELNDRITLVRTPPGGGAALTEDYFIEGINIDWGPGPDAKCVWRLSPAPAWNYWLAGTAGSSEAGTTTRAGY
jgi:hypothetical protein